MKIKLKKTNFVTFVYALYWHNKIRYCLIIPNLGHEGLVTAIEEEYDVVDPSIDDFCIRKSSVDGDILVHRVAEKDDLLDKLIDHDRAAMIELQRRLREAKLDCPPLTDGANLEMR